MSENNQLAVQPNRAAAIFSNPEEFNNAQRIARALASSDLVPEMYRETGNGKGLANTMLAMNVANRTGSDVLMVMQNMNVIQGKPSFSSKYIIAGLNTCGHFTKLKFKFTDKGPKSVTIPIYQWQKDQSGRNKRVKTGDETINYNDMECFAYCKEVATGEDVKGPTVSITMAIQEGWYTKADSKWKTMPEVMLQYRSASFFGNIHAPEITMGMRTPEEIEDIEYEIIQSETVPQSNKQAINDINQSIQGDTQQDDAPQTGQEQQEVI